jgi:hypothetical protein
VFDVGDAGDLGRDGAGELGRVVDHEVRADLRHDALEVLEHPWGSDAAEQTGELQRHPVLGRRLSPTRRLRNEACLRLKLVETGRMRIETDPTDVCAETRIRRENHAVAGSFEGAGERDHRVEMPVTDHAGEEDDHVGRRAT